MKKLTIDDMKSIELNIMDEIDRVCRENDIRYFLDYGSLLGAIRHGGFIPWDDDMDIVMFRDDYERFFELFSEKCQISNYRLISARDESSPVSYFKVVDTSTLVEEGFTDKRYWNGVWVDIFPLDYAQGADFEKSCKRLNRISLLRYLSSTQSNSGTNFFVRSAKRVVCPFAKMKSPYKIAKSMDDLAKIAGEPGDMVSVIVHGEHPVHRFNVLLYEPMEIDFEDRKYLIPKGYEEILSRHFGEWRTPVKEMPHSCNVYSLVD